MYSFKKKEINLKKSFNKMNLFNRTWKFNKKLIYCNYTINIAMFIKVFINIFFYENLKFENTILKPSSTQNRFLNMIYRCFRNQNNNNNTTVKHPSMWSHSNSSNFSIFFFTSISGIILIRFTFKVIFIK